MVNSLNYGKKGGQTEIRLYDMDSMIMVDVSDNGIGIAKNEIPRLFERFYRADKSRSKDKGGTGLGLAICKHIIEAHHQNINVSSKLDQGSSFSFTLQKA
jgi:two-component system phosphate regulon sensor histidine kinase PhoR